ncbi:MAG TPA: serine--tRNA ligase [Candidatus Altiarchaeales archaeon]|nr:serine--tRNA ligase [Candidatus Altiarchaeales archaeon]
MEFFLVAELKLSRNIQEEEKEKITNLLLNSESVLRKGAPQGKGAKITKFSFDGDKIILEITSDRYVRPHAAIFRIKNFLAKELGKELRMGIRKISARSYRIKFEVPETPRRSIKLPFVDEIKFSGNLCEIYLSNLDEDFLRKNYVDRIISLINEKIEREKYRGKAEHHEIIYTSPKREHFSTRDPTEEMIKRNWIKHYGKGRWIFGIEATKIMRTFEEIVIREILIPLNFHEVIIPKTVYWDIWKKSGHAKSIYPEMYYICEPKSRDPGFWEEVMDYFKITGEIPLEKIKDNIKEPLGGYTYAQCPPFWKFLEGKTLPLEDMPIKVFDRSGPSMRYESGGIHGIERVDEFHRIELIWIGTPEQVTKIHKEIVERYKRIFNDILELEWRMAWVTPWFMAQEGLVGLADESQVIGTIDFEAYLPYRGSRENSEWLEFQNASNNGDKYTKGFKVKVSGHEELWSGCSGIGLERWLAAFIAQKGINPENWPKRFLAILGELPKGIRFL